jgi:hypothetical protein
MGRTRGRLTPDSPTLLATLLRALAAMAGGQSPTLFGIHHGLRAAAGSGFQAKYGVPDPGFFHLQALGPKPPQLQTVTLLPSCHSEC